MSNPHILANDQGTTSSRAMIFSAAGNCVAVAQQEFQQIFPQDGWVEHDPEEIWQSVLVVCRQVLQQAKEAGIEVVGIVSIGCDGGVGFSLALEAVIYANKNGLLEAHMIGELETDVGDGCPLPYTIAGILGEFYACISCVEKGWQV